MDGLIKKHSAIMDKYDPEKKVALVVDEWGAWYAPLPGSNPGFLVQQNSLRDAILAALNLNIFARHADRVRMANIAQMINVLQAMITDRQREDGSDADLLRLQNVRAVPGRHVRAGDVSMPAPTRTATSPCRASTPSPPKSKDGKLWLEITNLDPNQPVGDRGEPGRDHRQVGLRRNPDRAEGGQRQHLRRAEYRRAEAYFGEGSRRQADSETGAEVGDRSLS